MPCAVQGTHWAGSGAKTPERQLTSSLRGDSGAQDTGCPRVAEATHDSQEAVQMACHGPDSVPRFTRRGHNSQGLRA